jgi:hypothetical protein
MSSQEILVVERTRGDTDTEENRVARRQRTSRRVAIAESPGGEATEVMRAMNFMTTCALFIAVSCVIRDEAGRWRAGVVCTSWIEWING